MTRYSQGKIAWAICDICGFRFFFKEAVWDGNTLDKSLRVHPECADELNLDIVLSRRVYNDAEALRDPRPNINLANVFPYPSADSTTWTADSVTVTCDQIYFNPLTP